MRPTLRHAFVVFALAAGLAWPLAKARAPTPTVDVDAEPAPVPSLIAQAVVTTLRDGHYKPRPIDDALSREWFDAYLEALDPDRIYFTAADVAGFRTLADKLDDDALTVPPGLAPEHVVFDRYRERVRERIAYAVSVLREGDFRFDDPKATVDVDRDENDAWASDRAELDALWQPRVAAAVLDLVLADKTGDQAAAQLERRYQRLERDIASLKPYDVLELYLGAFSTRFDPHSQWLKPAEKRNFDIEMRDTLTGIGAQLRSIDGYVTIMELIPGGPAVLSGELAAKDQILMVAQGDGEPVDVVEMRLDDVVEMIRGPEGTTVVLTIHPGDASDPSETRQVRLVRAKIKVAESAAKGSYREIGGHWIGLIDVPSFYVDSEGRRAGDPDYGSTTGDVARILADFRAEGVDAVVVDLRRNGGGSLDEAVSLTGLFLPGGPVVQIRDGRGRVEVLEDEDPAVAWAGPLVVLTSEGSASASEIFAGAIQDYGIGLVVGAKSTHGKGSVQNLLPLDRFVARAGVTDPAVLLDGTGALKITTHMFYRVSGSSTQVLGVEADIVLPSPFQGLDEWKEGSLDNPLPWHRIKPASYAKRPPAFDLEGLRKASAARVSQSMGFAFLEEDLQVREELRARTSLSLHLPTRTAEIERNETMDKNREQAWRLAGYDPEAKEGAHNAVPDVILDEAAHIAADLAGARKR